MPEPVSQPHAETLRRVALRALLGGIALMLLKMLVYTMTNSAAVLSDALESIINLVAACVAMYGIWLSNQPADRDHPYGHGKVEFIAAGMEGWMIFAAGALIAFEGVKRLVFDPVELSRLDTGIALLGGVAALSLVLALYVYVMGRRCRNLILIADGKHLLTDVISTVGVIGGLVLVRWTGKLWIDPVVALVMAAIVFWTSWRLLLQSSGGLMDRMDPEDDAAICRILDRCISAGKIRGYHKVRHRHSGTFHWIDMHLQVDPDMTVRDSHALASEIEHEIEEKLGQANATAHVEPADDTSVDVPPAENVK
ncbi:MAG: cation transporter [Phycisphaeraceae bacterium]|nr:cation transporter [Phycisphaeraceae bacterium]